MCVCACACACVCVCVCVCVLKWVRHATRAAACEGCNETLQVICVRVRVRVCM